MKIEYNDAVMRVSDYLVALRDGKTLKDYPAKEIMKETIQSAMARHALALPENDLAELTLPEDQGFFRMYDPEVFGPNTPKTKDIHGVLQMASADAVKAMSGERYNIEEIDDIDFVLDYLDTDTLEKIPKQFKSLHGESMDKAYIDRITSIRRNYEHNGGLSDTKQFGITDGEYIHLREIQVDENRWWSTEAPYATIEKIMAKQLSTFTDPKEYNRQASHYAAMNPVTGAKFMDRVLQREDLSPEKREMAKMSKMAAEQSLARGKGLELKQNEYFDKRWEEACEKSAPTRIVLAVGMGRGNKPAFRFEDVLKPKSAIPSDTKTNDLDEGYTFDGPEM